MSRIRVIPRLDIKGSNLIKGVHLEGLRVIGDPQQYATRYYEQGADELIYMDIVASLYERNNLRDIVSRTARNVFIPLTVGGGVRTVDDVKALLRSGADKVAINTAAVRRPELLSEASRAFGAQCIVLSIEAKAVGPGRWEVYTDCGREHSGLDVVEWVKKAATYGIGEILVTSIDQEGTRKGYDVDLIKAVSEAADVPVIASGGMGTTAHFVEVCKRGRPDAVAMADVLHYDRLGLEQIRAAALAEGIDLRSKH